MIFGYNTEIRLGDTVYHVQSEARDYDRLLETQVFVKGHCISKRAVPSEHEADPGSVQEALRLQHRSVVECIRAGRLELVQAETPDLNFNLRCTGVKREGGELVLGFQVTRAGVAVSDVKLRCFLARPESALPLELISEPITDDAGMAMLRIDGARSANAELQVEMGRRRTKKRSPIPASPAGEPLTYTSAKAADLQ